MVWKCSDDQSANANVTLVSGLESESNTWFPLEVEIGCITNCTVNRIFRLSL